MQLGQTIAKIRKENNLSQEEFGERFCVTRQTVSNWEREKSYPDLLTLIRISDEFGYSLDCMLKEDDEMANKMNEDMKRGRKTKGITMVGLALAVLATVLNLTCFIKQLSDGFESAAGWLGLFIVALITVAFDAALLLRAKKS